MRRSLRAPVLVLWNVLLLLALLGIAELGLRAFRSEWSLVDFRGEHRNLLRSAYPAVFDATLGWVPEAGASGLENIWGTEVHIDERGLRSNGNPDPPADADAAILAVGDSFTFGDQVSDHETWPAILERLSDRRVYNGGVFGYGIDQIVLRAETLVDELAPKTLVYSFLGEDVFRAGLSRRSNANKPYFDLVADELVLRNVPVPAPSAAEPVTRWLGYSLAVHELMRRIRPAAWLEDHRPLETAGAADVRDIACRLFQRLERFSEGRVELRVLVQSSSLRFDQTANYLMADHALSCLRDRTRILDIRPLLRDAHRRSPERARGFFDGHMTPQGNEFVARFVDRSLRRAAKPGRRP